MVKIADEKYMSLAIAKAREGIAKGQSPFGACLVKSGNIVACEHNHVRANNDPTAHAEIQAIRVATKKLKNFDSLIGATIYSTCEPCPMCFAACYWAGISRIVYGSSISDSVAAGFAELTITNLEMKKLGTSKIEITGGFLKQETNKLWEEWQKKLGLPY